ncbi:FliA/WhiG family RNA polymerase sigma factor [bacterium]|nr:FliA/WhiG family RNA polymerase sigma factor [bacterium]
MSIAAKTCLSPEEKEQMARQHAGLVKHIASRMAVSLPDHLEVDDLIHDGVVGLMEALNRFDPSKGIKFQTFAASRVRGAILDALRALDWASRGVRRRHRDLQKAEEQLSHSLGRAPSVGEVSQVAGISHHEVHRRRQEATLTHVLSLDDQRSPDSDERPGDSLSDQAALVEEVAFRNQKKQMLLRGLKTLQEREQLILSLYYFEELNIREIGQILGVTEARISQIHSRCLMKLRAFLTPHLQQSQRVG